jgi:hypothetical protein
MRLGHGDRLLERSASPARQPLYPRPSTVPSGRRRCRHHRPVPGITTAVSEPWFVQDAPGLDAPNDLVHGCGCRAEVLEV